MLKLIRADFYKTFHRSYFYVMALIIAALCFVMNFALRGGTYGSASCSTMFAMSLLSFPIFILPMITQIVFSEEYQSHTLKNTAAYGTNRMAIYTSKCIISVLLGVILAAVVLVAYFGGMFLFLPVDAKFNSELLREFFTRLAAASSVYIACISMAVCFSGFFSRNGMATFLYYGVFYLTEYLLQLLHLSKGNEYLLKTQIGLIMQSPITQLRQPVIISLVTMAVFFVGGAALFQKKDLC